MKLLNSFSVVGTFLDVERNEGLFTNSSTFFLFFFCNQLVGSKMARNFILPVDRVGQTIV